MAHEKPSENSHYADAVRLLEAAPQYGGCYEQRATSSITAATAHAVLAFAGLALENPTANENYNEAARLLQAAGHNGGFHPTASAATVNAALARAMLSLVDHHAAASGTTPHERSRAVKAAG